MRPSELLHPLRRRAPIALTADARPLLAPDVAFERADDGAASIALVHGVPSSRVSPAVVELLTAMDGRTCLDDLHRRFAAAESLEGFVQLVQRFRACGLLDGDPRPLPGRIAFRPPFTLQFATLRAPALFRRLDRLMLHLPLRAAATGLIVLLIAGLVAFAMQAGDVLAAVASPVPLADLLGLVAVLLLLTLLHESAHGLTLTRFGGTPRRAGVMLFYLTPAFFVDVTDGWRLSDRRHRVAIALAGPALHAAVGAAAVLVALALPASSADRFLLLLALSCAAIVLVNLVPFVRFDGYIALMSALDEPNMRARSIQDAGGVLATVLFGAARRAPQLDRWWSVPFGLASLATPIVLVVVAVARMARALAAGGPVVGLLLVALEAAVAVVGLVLVGRALRRILRSGVPRLRFTMVCVGLLASIAVAGVVVTVPASVAVGYVVRGDRVLLVHAGETVGPAPSPDARVELRTAGLLVNAPVGGGVMTPLPRTPITVPLDALFPVSAAGMSVDALVVGEVRVPDGAAGLPTTGQAHVDGGERSLWSALWDAAVAHPLSTPPSPPQNEK